MTRSLHLDSSKESKVEELFRAYFTSMCKLAYTYVADLDVSKDIVHEVFTSFWLKFESLPEDTNYKGYLFTSTRNKSLNYIRDNRKHLNVVEVEENISDENQVDLETKELAREIEYGIQLLPDRCREVFELSRFENMKYGQIADHLGISVKTVEGQMSKALRLLREHLKDFLVFIIILFGLG